MADRFPLKILVAEDNAINQQVSKRVLMTSKGPCCVAPQSPINQQVSKRVLMKYGYASDLAVNGQEAIAAVERERYDVISMDVQMPDTDGLEATRRICEMLTPSKRPYIVALTASAMKEDRAACTAAGMEGFLTKPIRQAEVKAVLDQTIARLEHG